MSGVGHVVVMVYHKNKLFTSMLVLSEIKYTIQQDETGTINVMKTLKVSILIHFIGKQAYANSVGLDFVEIQHGGKTNKCTI